MTRCAATGRNIKRSQNRGVSPPCRHRVATVAAVATPPLEPANLALLIEQLREEGALLQHHENALLIRPTHWQQVDRLNPHWKALLLFLQTNENGDDDGLGQSA